MYAAADVLLLNQKTAVKDAVIPSKLLTYMAAGKPVFCAAHEESEAARLIREAQCGQIVEPENPHALAEGDVPCASTPHSASRWEQAGGPMP